MKTAEWAPCARDARTVGGWTLRALVEETPLVLATAAVASFCFAVAFLDPYIGVTSLPRRDDFRRKRRRRAPRELSRLAPWPRPCPCYPIRLEIRRNGVSTGFDDAIVSFLDGWMIVEGLRCSFSLSPRGVWTTDGKIWLPNGREVLIQTYDRLGDRRGAAATFEAAFEHWSNAASPSGEPVLPPETAHPWAFGRGYGTMLLGLSLLGASAALFHTGNGLWTMVGLPVGLNGLWWTVRPSLDLVQLRRFRRAGR